MFTLARRVFAGLSLSAGTVILVLITQAAAVPVYLTRWGSQTYGEWLTLINLAASLSLLNLGIQAYVGNRLIAAYERGDRAEGTRMLHAALRLYVILCCLALVVLFSLAFWTGLPARLHIQSLSTIQARLILVIFGSVYVYGILGGMLMTLLRVRRQMPRQLTYSLVETSILISLPVAVAAAGGRPLHAAIAAGVLFVAISLVELVDIRKRSPFPIGLSGADWGQSLALIGPSLTFFAVSLSAQLLVTGMTLAISLTVGAAAVALYSTTLMLTNFVRIVVSQGLNVLWPEVTAAAATLTDPGRLVRWHRLALKLIGGLVLAAAAVIGLLGPDILAVWTRGEVAVDPWLNALLVLYLVVQTPALVSGVFGLALNRQRDMLGVHLVTAVASVALAAWLLPRYGLRAAALSLLLGQMLGTVWVTRLSSRWTSDTWQSLARRVWLRGAPTLAAVLLATVGASALPGLLSRALAVPALLAVAALMGWQTWLTGPERHLLITRWPFAAVGLPKRAESEQASA